MPNINRNPVYDNDYVTLAYLKQFSDETVTVLDEKYSKNYGTQPQPPYYVNDTWTDVDGRLFVCTNTRLVGSYNSSDWYCIIDTEDYDALVVKSLDSVVDMLDVQTTDYKIETWLASTDPSDAWETNLEKEQHLYDFWKTYSNGKVYTYIYNKFATNPVRYGWTHRDSSEDVWDTTDGHKNLFGKKPTTYEKHDLWRIEEDINDFDLPEGCLPGDWAVCTKNNTEYNKEDWTNKTVYINLDELAKTVYTKTEIDNQYQVLEDEITTGLTKTENTILAEVSQTYTTKETTKYLVDDLGEVSDTVDAHTSSIASLELSVGQIKSEISDFADVTASSEDFGSVSIADVAEGEPVSIKIHPTNNQDISYLYPRINLYPSPTLYPTTRTLLFETEGYSIKYELPADLLYFDDETYDEFELNYESNQVVVTKRVSIDEYGVKSKLETPVVTNYPFPSLPLQAGDYTITLLGHTYAYIFVRLLVANIYTDQFPTKAQMNSAITQTAASINSEVAKKVGKTEIISTINQTAEAVLIDASRINMVGVMTAINNNTTTTINGNKITTGTITADKLKVGTITAEQIASSAITTDKIATSAITAAKISGGAITSDKINAGAVTTAKLSADAVTADKIQANAVTVDKIQAGAITADKIATNAVTSDKIISNAITSSKIATNAITADKIQANAITTDKIQANAITADKIKAGAITAEKVSADIITTSNFSAQKISADNITVGTIDANTITIKNLNASNITSGSLSANRLYGGTITSSAITMGSVFNLNTSGHFKYYNGVGYMACGQASGTLHPWFSAVEVNRLNGIEFRDGTEWYEAGTMVGDIYITEGNAMMIRSNGTVNINKGSGGNVGIKNLVISGSTITGENGGYMYANSNCMLHPVSSSYYAYVRTTDSSNRIATSSSGPSSKNVKTNFVDIANEYESIYNEFNKINMYTYDYKYEGIRDSKEDFGFIIDELEDTEYLSKYIRNYPCRGRIEGNRLIPKSDDSETEADLPFEYKEWERDSYIKFSLILIKALQYKIEELEVKLNG